MPNYNSKIIKNKEKEKTKYWKSKSEQEKLERTLNESINLSETDEVFKDKLETLFKKDFKN